MTLFKSQKHVFWQALIGALIIFNLGIFLGYMLESSRVGKVSQLYAESELELFDVKIQDELYSSGNLDCELAVQENINFADKIYEAAKILDNFEKSSRLTDSIKIQHKKYDLLRTMFWLNSVKIKKQCNAFYHNVVYFYQYNEPSMKQKAEQAVFSRLLGELKNKYGNEIMLIPIAGDNKMISVDLLMKTYNLTALPVILIDEKTKITELASMEQVEKYLR